VNYTEADVPLLGVRSVDHAFRLDLRPLNLTEGDVVAIRAAPMNAPIPVRTNPGPNSG
jgi:hypothetical protein